ncbi:MAG: carboxymuconolactone decarboxylase family protein [Burkholderiales bacterium]
MARVPLLDENAGADVAAAVAKIRGKRGGRLLNFYRALLHSPALASAWLDFNNAVRYETGLDERVRELAIMRVAVLNGADYVLRIHQERYAEAAGVTPAEVEALRDWRKSGSFGPEDAALLAYVDAMTRDVEVPDAVFREMGARFSKRAAVELTVLIAAYNMHTRVLRALDIDPEKA